MKFAVFTLAAAALGANALPSDLQYTGMFKSWMERHGKQYPTSEVADRMAKFKVNDAKIKAHNAGNHTWTMEHNQFSDLSKQEFLDMYTGLNHAQRTHDAKFHETGKGDINADIDWVGAGAVTAVKDQGRCGSCWAFSATGGMEGAIQLASKTLPILSEQELVDCAGSYGNGGCQGGLMDEAFDYAIANGACTEAEYAYKGSQNTCKKDGCAAPKAAISGYNDVSSGDEAGLLAALAKGPVSIAVDAGAFQSYGSGVLEACSGRTLDHGVLAVGYDGTNWKVKNSWGAGWGEGGYINLPYGKNCCGLSLLASQPVV